MAGPLDARCRGATGGAGGGGAIGPGFLGPSRLHSTVAAPRKVPRPGSLFHGGSTGRKCHRWERRATRRVSGGGFTAAAVAPGATHFGAESEAMVGGFGRAAQKRAYTAAALSPMTLEPHAADLPSLVPSATAQHRTRLRRT